MGLHRQFHRVDMNYPISCIFSDNDLGRDIKATGFVDDLSMGGMKIRVPIPPELYNATSLVYSLKLPEPFHTLTGQGAIIWHENDASQNVLMLGVAFSCLSQNDRVTIQTIIHELVDNESTR